MYDDWNFLCYSTSFCKIFIRGGSEKFVFSTWSAAFMRCSTSIEHWAMRNEHCLSLAGTWHTVACRCFRYTVKEIPFVCIEKLKCRCTDIFKYIYLLCDHLKKERKKSQPLCADQMLTQSKSCLKSFTKVRTLIVTLLLTFMNCFVRLH